MAAITDIRMGDHWLLDGDLIAVVVEKPDTDESLEVNHVCPQGILIAGVTVLASKFRTKMRPDQARRQALERMQAAVLRHLQFA